MKMDSLPICLNCKLIKEIDIVIRFVIYSIKQKFLLLIIHLIWKYVLLTLKVVGFINNILNNLCYKNLFNMALLKLY